MYTEVSQSFTDAINADVRWIAARITHGSEVVTGDDILSLSISHCLEPFGRITVGSASSQMLAAVVRADALSVNIGDALAVDIGVRTAYDEETEAETYEFCPMGAFYVKTISSDGGNLTIIAFDAMTVFDQPYNPTDASLAVNARYVIRDIAAQTRAAISSGYSNVNLSLTKGTMREQIAWIAGASGKHAVFSRDGLMVFKYYADSGLEITEDDILLGGLSETALETIGGILATSAEGETRTGTDPFMRIVNPYTKAWLIPDFYTIIGRSFTPCTIVYRGNPCIDAGDIITLNDNPVYVMSLTTEINGGLRQLITCYGIEASDVQDSAQLTRLTVDGLDKSLDSDGIFERLTDNGTKQGLFRDDAGNLYVNASHIGTGILSSSNGNYSLNMTTGEVNMKSAAITGGYIDIDTSGGAHSNNTIVLRNSFDPPSKAVLNPLELGIYGYNDTESAYIGDGSSWGGQVRLKGGQGSIELVSTDSMSRPPKVTLKDRTNAAKVTLDASNGSVTCSKVAASNVMYATESIAIAQDEQKVITFPAGFQGFVSVMRRTTGATSEGQYDGLYLVTAGNASPYYVAIKAASRFTLTRATGTITVSHTGGTATCYLAVFGNMEVTIT